MLKGGEGVSTGARARGGRVLTAGVGGREPRTGVGKTLTEREPHFQQGGGQTRPKEAQCTQCTVTVQRTGSVKCSVHSVHVYKVYKVYNVQSVHSVHCTMYSA